MPRSRGVWESQIYFSIISHTKQSIHWPWDIIPTFWVGSLEDSVMCQNIIVVLPKSKNALISFSCSIVKQQHRRVSIKGSSVPSCPIWCNPLISTEGCTLSHKCGERHGIETVGKLYSDKIIPFQQPKNQFGHLDSTFFNIYRAVVYYK